MHSVLLLASLGFLAPPRARPPVLPRRVDILAEPVLPNRVAILAEPGSALDAPLRFPKLGGLEHLHGIENAYQLNQGKAIDSLRRDYPLLLEEEPDFSIFTEDIELFDPSGKRLSGLQQYASVFSGLRLLRRAAMTGSEVTYRLVVHDQTIRVRWTAKLWMRAMLPGLGSDTPVQLDGVSVYELDSEGMIKLHRLEKIVMTGLGATAPVSLAFAWPIQEAAVPKMARPFFRALDAALRPPAHPPLAVEAPTPVVEACGGCNEPAALSRWRAPPPQACASGGEERETPMERAARERMEMQEEARRLRALRKPKESGKQGFGGFFFGMPQVCESNYDCESPTVCCDLVFASVCCSSGMMVGSPNPQMQGSLIPIPIPVEKDVPGGAQHQVGAQYPGGQPPPGS